MRKILLYISLLIFNLVWILTLMSLEDPWPLAGSQGKSEGVQDKSGALLKDLETNFYGRSLLIRLRNQIHYSLFDEIHVRNVLEGPTGILFEQRYLQTARGLDALPIGELLQRLSLWKKIVDESGVSHTLVLAPGKAAVLDTAYWPERFRLPADSGYNFNYNQVKNWLDTVVGVDYIDYLKRFKESRPDEHLNFPKNGVHWSQFSISIVSSELTQKVEGLSLVLLDTIESEPFGTDEDIEESMNLLFDKTDTQCYRVNSRWEHGDSLPKILIIGDSFAWGPVNEGILKSCADSSEFWYYNAQRFGPQVPSGGAQLLKTLQLNSLEDMIERISTFDHVFWIVTDANLKKFPFDRFGYLK